MKRKLFNYLIIAIIAIGFVSCGDDEETRDPNRPYKHESTTALNFGPLASIADADFGLTKTMKLDTVVPKYSSYVTGGTLKQNSSNIKIKGVNNIPGGKDLVKMKNFTLEVKGTSNKLVIGDVKEDMEIDSNEALNFLQNSVNALASNKMMEVTVSFKSATEIGLTHNVIVQLNYHTDFTLE